MALAAEAPDATGTNPLIGEATPSPAGPLEPGEAAGLPAPPEIQLPRLLQVLRFNQRQIEFVFGARRRLGDVFRMLGVVRGDPVITSHPDHGVRTATKQLLNASTWRLAQIPELMNIGRDEPVGFTRAGLSLLDAPVYAVIASRRRAADLEGRHDILSVLLQARTEDGEA